MLRWGAIGFYALLGFSTWAGEAHPNAALELLLDNAARYVEQAEYDRAAGSLERALRIEPNNAEIWHLLGQVRLHQGEYAQAEAMAQKSNTFAANQKDLQQHNQHLIHVARKLGGQQVSAIHTDAVNSDVQAYRGVDRSIEPAPIATATQPTWTAAHHEPPPTVALLPPPPPAVLPVTRRDEAGVQLIYEPDSRDERVYREYESVPRDFVPSATIPLNQNVFRLDLLLRDLQRYRDQRAAYRVKLKPEKHANKNKKNKKYKKRRKSRDSD